MPRKAAKPKSPGFACTGCGQAYRQWQGQCDECGAWGSIAEVEAGSPPAPGVARGQRAKAIPLTEVGGGASEDPRRATGDPELDRVLGGGVVRGSLILLGGEPGIGKSTLLLSLSGALAKEGGKVLYVCGEESPAQIKLRAERIDAVHEGVALFPELDVGRLVEALHDDPPDLVIVDSVQTLRSAESAGVPGSPSQLAAVTSTLMAAAKSLQVACVVVAHVNKEGDIAGPKFLEHMVDVVLYFEGDRDQGLRFLRSVKNRFGPAGELGIFSMEERGLIPVGNPSALFHSQDAAPAAGSCVAAGVEGSRCYLVEVQALVSPAVHAYPRRLAQGYEQGRLTVLTAVLERRLGVPLSREDVCIKVVGGLSLREPAMDLAAALAILSSRQDQPLPPRTAFAGEVGLGGEVRPVGMVSRRAKEAARLGFEALWVPPGVELSEPGVKVRSAAHLGEVASKVLAEA